MGLLKKGNPRRLRWGGCQEAVPAVVGAIAVGGRTGGLGMGRGSGACEPGQQIHSGGQTMAQIGSGRRMPRRITYKSINSTTLTGDIAPESSPVLSTPKLGNISRPCHPSPLATPHLEALGEGDLANHQVVHGQVQPVWQGWPLQPQIIRTGDPFQHNNGLYQVVR